MTKANDRRVKASLERTRLALKVEERELETRRREIHAERVAAVGALREVCGAYGDNIWSDDLALDRIIREHLLAPLAAELAAVRRYTASLRARAERPPAHEVMLALATAAPPPKPPMPLRPTPLPDQVHRVIVVRAQLHGEHGFRARCVCGWSSPLVAAEDAALLAGSRHQDDHDVRVDSRQRG